MTMRHAFAPSIVLVPLMAVAACGHHGSSTMDDAAVDALQSPTADAGGNVERIWFGGIV